MNYMCQNSIYEKNCKARFVVITTFLSIVLLQASVTCGANPQAYSPKALAASRLSCVNPPSSSNAIPATPAPATPGYVLINEVLSFPTSPWNCTVTDASYDNSDLANAWIEIYNPQNQPLDLYAARAWFDMGTYSYRLPFGSIIAAHGFLVLFPFITASPVPLIKLIITQVVIDQVSLPSLPADTTYARIPDGSDTWQITTMPTITTSNSTGMAQTPRATSTQHHPSVTSTQHHTPTPKSTHTHTQSGGTSSDEATIDASSTGVQPTWDALRLPSAQSHNTTTQPYNSSLASVSSNTPADSFGLLNKILLSMLVIIFSCVLLWSWRLYRRKKGHTIRFWPRLDEYS